LGVFYSKFKGRRGQSNNYGSYERKKLKIIDRPKFKKKFLKHPVYRTKLTIWFQELDLTKVLYFTVA
jgi:hypothetical protein